jgi:hypothetical protein
MQITILPANRIETVISIKNGDETKTVVKMLGELSLELLNFDNEPICKKAHELSLRLAALQPSKRMSNAVNTLSAGTYSLSSNSCNSQ